MKDRKASRAMDHLDDGLILSAMDRSDWNGKQSHMILGGRKMKYHAWMKWGSIAAAFALILTAVLITGSLLGSASEAIIALDVNPSIEIEINKNEKVKEIKALNPDAEIVLADLPLEGVDLNVAVKAIIGSMVTNGYLSVDQNSILVSIDARNGKQATELKQKLEGEISTLLGGKNISASVITQRFEKKGESGETVGDTYVSKAKSELIKKIVAAGLLDANGVPYKYETLAKLKVNELKLILDSKSFKVENVDTAGTAGIGKYISAEEALSAALTKASLTAAEVPHPEIEMDYDDDHRTMVYEIEWIFDGQEYEYEISAENGAVLEEEIKPADERDDDERLTPPENAITREAALNAAYADAKVEAANVRRPEIELDRERGTYVYEIEFKSGSMEYEYMIHAITGEILAREVEPID